jgi:hypothetical protein
MPGISTEYLAEQIEASNERLTKAIDDLTRKVEDGQKEFISFRLDLTDKLSAIRNSLSWAKGIAVLVALPVVFGVAAWSCKAADRAARIEESVIALRDHAKEQDARISALIDLQHGPRQGHGAAKNDARSRVESGVMRRPHRRGEVQ